MDAKYIIKWTFTPEDYFEEPFKIEDECFEMWVDIGTVKAEIVEEICFDPNIEAKKLHSILEGRFYGAEIFLHKPFSLSGPSIIKLDADGRKHYYLHAKSGVVAMTVGRSESELVDKNGKLILSTRRDRIEKILLFSELVSKYKLIDPVVDSIITSYHNAIIYPENEFVYLYEIRDALVDRFGNEKNAIDAIKVSRKSFRRLRQLACNEPLAQGRHRGEHVGKIRAATEVEIAEARTIARKMIMNYLLYIDNKK